MPTESTPIYNVSTSQLNQLDLIYLIKTFVKKIVPHLDGNFIKIINKKKTKQNFSFTLQHLYPLILNGMILPIT